MESGGGGTIRTQYQGETIDKHALVDLPPGHDQQDASRHDIVYLMRCASRQPARRAGQASTLADLPQPPRCSRRSVSCRQ